MAPVTTTPAKITRILVADDHPIVLSGLRRMLDAQADFEVVAEAADGVQAVEQTLLADPDLAILDIYMPRKTGLQAARATAPRRAGAHALHARQQAIPLRGAERRRLRLRAQDRRRPRSHRCLPGCDPR
jgi:DNA-binding NarL/FixJ family response regulator